MPLTAGDVLAPVRQQLADTVEPYRRADPTLLGYLTLAQQQVVLARPDAYSVIRPFECAAGSEQAIPDDAYRFLGGVQNLGADGATPGRAIANTDMGAKDAYDPNWRVTVGTKPEVRECVFDALLPRTFWVAPAVPANPTVQIGIRLSLVPPALKTTDDALVVPPLYAMALVAFTLGLAYGENSEVGDKQLGVQYWNQAMALIGAKSKTEAGLPPGPKTDRS